MKFERKYVGGRSQATGSRPFQSNRRRLWLQATKRVDWNEDRIRNARVCSAHFISGEMSLDCSSPDFVPSVFTYTKQSQTPGTIGKGGEMTDLVLQQTNVFLLKLRTRMQPEEDIPFPKREYDDLNLRYCQLQEDYVNLRQEFDTLCGL
ncbi:hypothetical protein N1851_005906 [Merluccius polli]|uniref:THAP-type domain-containing protein n=1 Tax=Merluccius polli TaxID=89951 RepID=A0AA47N6F5_MERPO|nr:hypothetical protein N1851_005906 [Merluccius polli]